MRPLPLHVKSSILASIVSLIVLFVGMVVASGSLARQIQDEQTQIAALQAENLAEELSNAPDQFDLEGLRHITNIVSGSRPNLFDVRVWKVENQKFVESASSDDSLPDEVMSDEVQNALLSRADSTSKTQIDTDRGDPLFRIYSPIVVDDRVVGAVEAAEKLDTVWSITWRYGIYLWWVLLLTVAFIGAAFYLLFQRLVYAPLGSLLDAMELARAGDLSVELEQKQRPDEFGLLLNNFNLMMSQIREMTTERERRNEVLQARIADATAELTQKNAQLELSNIELFRTTRKMSEMERLAAAGQTAAQFAHEVGTPLNLISGHAQLLRTAMPTGSNERKRLQIIGDQIERIEKIVREMLDRTRFGKSVPVPVDLNGILQRTISAMEPTIAGRQVVLSTALSDDLPEVLGDHDRLQQVFLNLINNAIDALPAGGDLRISTSSANNRVLIEFDDNGAGMTDEIRSNIFQPLFTTKERGQGTGLGLYVVKQILDEHGADIRVRSAIGDGTSFELIFQAIS